MYSTVANQKRKSGEKKRRELETETGGYGGSGGNRGQRRGDGKANRSEQLRGKEGTTCFAVSLTPAIIHIERNHSCSLKAVFSCTCKIFCVGILLILSIN